MATFRLLKRSLLNKHREACENEQKSQSYQQEHTGKRRHAKERTIQISDTALVRQYKQKKLITRFNKTPRKGTKVTTENSKQRITSDESHFKVVGGQCSINSMGTQKFQKYCN